MRKQFCHWLRGEIVIEPDNILIMLRYAQNTFANFTQSFSPRLQHANALTKWEKANLASIRSLDPQLFVWCSSGLHRNQPTNFTQVVKLGYVALCAEQLSHKRCQLNYTSRYAQNIVTLWLESGPLLVWLPLKIENGDSSELLRNRSLTSHKKLDMSRYMRRTLSLTSRRQKHANATFKCEERPGHYGLPGTRRLEARSNF